LVIDTPNLAWKAYHTTGGLDKGVIFGVLRQFIHLHRVFCASSTVWCFDMGKQRRQSAYPDYKKTRRLENMTEKDRNEKLGVIDQINALKNDILPPLGFRNILSQKGFEADDLIARTCCDLRNGDTATVVSSDKDFYQILTSRVKIWNGRTILTDKTFVLEYGFLPYLWSNLLAFVGGHDDIEGIKGVGEVIASSYLRGKNPKDARRAHKKGWERIDSEEGQKIKKRNLPIVTIPYPGTKSFPLNDDYLNPVTWDKTCEEMDLKSLLGLCPPSNLEVSLSPQEVGMP